MSLEADLRAALEMALAGKAAAEAREANNLAERNHYFEVAQRVQAAEARAAAQELLLTQLTSTKDPLSPMARLAQVSAEKSESEASASDQLQSLQKELELARGRIAELEDELPQDETPPAKE